MCYSKRVNICESAKQLFEKAGNFVAIVKVTFTYFRIHVATWTIFHDFTPFPMLFISVLFFKTYLVLNQVHCFNDIFMMHRGALKLIVCLILTYLIQNSATTRFAYSLSDSSFFFRRNSLTAHNLSHKLSRCWCA